MMKNLLRLSLLSAFALLAGVSFSACNFTDGSARIMIVGDSWGLLMCDLGAFDAVLSERGKSSVHISCNESAAAGTMAQDWTTDKYRKRIDLAFVTAKRADIVVLSLGGNDLIHFWNVHMTDAEDQALYQQIKGNIEKVISQILALRPKAKILISSYDYPNFGLLQDTALTKTYVDLYKQMGNPSAKDLNAALIGLEEVKRGILRDFTSVYYVSNLGLMQYNYGQPDYGIAPKILPEPGVAPGYSPFAGGHPDLPGPPDAFLSLLPGLKDPYHLSFDGFRLVVENLYAQFIGGWL